MRLFLILLTCTALSFPSSGQVGSCSFDESSFYFVSKNIRRKQYKKNAVPSEVAESLKKELVNQISTNVSVIKERKSQNVASGESGYYSSTSTSMSIISSVGSVNNASFKYRKCGRNYKVFCLVNKESFQSDLANDLKSKVSIFNKKLSSYSYAIGTGNLTLTNEEYERLKFSYQYLNAGIGFLSSSEYIEPVSKQSLIDEIGRASAKFLKIEREINSSFEKRFDRLKTNLNADRFEWVHYEIISLSDVNLSLSQSRRLKDFKLRFEEEFGQYTYDLDLKISQSIKKRDESLETNKLLELYSKTTFYKGQREKFEVYKKRLARRTGTARTNIYLGVSGGNSFQRINNESQEIQLEEINQKFNFDYVLPSFEFGLKHFLGDPKKRFGLSVSYKTYLDTQFKISEIPLPENSINDFGVAQVGIIKGPFELKYGRVLTDLELENLSILSLNWSLLRTDKFIEKFAKSNFLSLNIFAEYLSDFNKESYMQVGVGIYYNIATNRTSKFK